MMREFFEKRKKLLVILSSITVLFLILTIVFIALASKAEDDNVYLLYILISMYVALGFFIATVVKCNGVIFTDRYLKKRGLEHVLNDINLAQPNLPKSKIYCGSMAFFSKKPFSVVPYNDIAWIYVTNQKLYGVVTISKTTNIYMTNGKHLVLTCDVDEFRWFLENYLMRVNPNIILGYGVQQKQRYKAVKDAYKASMR